MNRNGIFLIASLMLGGQLLPGGAGVCLARAGRSKADKEPVTLTIQVDVQPKGSEQRRPAQPGETLHTGDRIALRVEVDRPAYVNVLQVFPGGSSAVLFPDPAARPAATLIKPGIPQVIPPGDAMFVLDDETGEENVLVVASARALSEVDLEQTKQLVAQPPPPAAALAPPFALKLNERKLVLPAAAKPYLMRVKAGPQGVAAARFWFKHAAASATSILDR